LNRIESFQFLSKLKITFHAIPLLRFVKNHLLTDITQDSTNNDSPTNRCDFSFGYVTIDQSRQVLCLHANDEHLVKYPLTGLWVKGIKNLKNKLLEKVLIAFIKNEALNKMDLGKNQFLLCLAIEGKVECFEINYELEPEDDFCILTAESELSDEQEEALHLKVTLLDYQNDTLFRKTYETVFGK
jgi:hypothetical protein